MGHSGRAAVLTQYIRQYGSVDFLCQRGVVMGEMCPEDWGWEQMDVGPGLPPGARRAALGLQAQHSCAAGPVCVSQKVLGTGRILGTSESIAVVVCACQAGGCCLRASWAADGDGGGGGTPGFEAHDDPGGCAAP